MTVTNVVFSCFLTVKVLNSGNNHSALN